MRQCLITADTADLPAAGDDGVSETPPWKLTVDELEKLFLTLT